MTINEYQMEALRTAGEADIVNGVLGLCGESGECADLILKNRKTAAGILKRVCPGSRWLASYRKKEDLQHKRTG